MKRALFAIAFAAIGCQTYDFEPVTPLAVGQTTQISNIIAHPLKPNVMLLLDKSGSMLTNTSTSAPCPATIGACGPNSLCPTGCATRISDLKSAMTTFLTDPMNSTLARVGAAYFPKDASAVCVPTSQGEVLVPLLGPALSDDDNALTMQSANVSAAIAGLGTPGGGTPTADSLRFVGSLEELQDPQRTNLVLLLTDGVPNCNDHNPNNECTAPNAACQCTTGSCTGAGSSLCSLGCLNADDSVAAIKELRNKSQPIKTIVVGFGSCGQAGNMSADCANAPQTLNQMAVAGGLARTCTVDADCSSMGVVDTCDATGHCNQSYYSAANGAELSKALRDISKIFNPATICTYELKTAPSDPKFLSVTVQGQVLQGCGVSIGGADVPGCNTWTYDGTGASPEITFQGTTCANVKNATPQNPVNVQVRIVSSL